MSRHKHERNSLPSWHYEKRTDTYELEIDVGLADPDHEVSTYWFRPSVECVPTWLYVDDATDERVPARALSIRFGLFGFEAEIRVTVAAATEADVRGRS